MGVESYREYLEVDTFLYVVGTAGGHSAEVRRTFGGGGRLFNRD